MRKADTRLLEELFQHEYKKLLLFARGKLKDNGRAEEIVQDVFLTAYQSIDAFNASPNPMGWLFNTLKNKLAHELRAKKVVVEYCSHEQMESFEYTPQESIHESSLTQALTEGELELAMRVYLDGMSTAEAAKLYGITTAACKKRLSRIRKKLEKFFDDVTI